MKYLKNNKTIIAILLAAVALRILWMVFIPTVPVSDFLLYHKGALSILSGKGYRIYGYLSAYEPIGYSAFLVTIYFLFGSSIIAAKIANIVLSVVNILLIMAIMKQTGFNKKVILLAAALFSVMPIQIMYTSVVSTEVLFTTSLLLITYVLFSNLKYKDILLGAIIGIAALIKPYMMIFQFLIFVYYIFTEFNLKLALKSLMLITVMMAIVIAPWTIRNYTIFHKFIPISTNGGYNLYVNNNPYATGAWQDPFKIPNSPLKIYKHKNDEFWNEVKVDEEGKKLAYNWILHNPVDFVKVGFKKLANVFVVPDNAFWATGYLKDQKHLPQSVYSVINIITLIIHMVFSIAVLIYLLDRISTLFREHKLGKIHIFIILLMAFYAAISFIFEGQPRYLFPLWSYYIMAALAVAESVIKKYRGGKASYERS
ncbi:glycosyltransferase family 39 protein [Clostridium oryzae]|uniref:glycosyltransferase family 39 protein n=1 Tax=Clostridium oryzae TaxID=1450648 RepID=UPI0014755B0E|nr:glycosyltransferase family 39 protein [Clostridium oryzae]